MAFRKIILLIGLCTGMHLSSGQPTNTILVKAGEDATKVIPRNLQYHYPEFQDGRLIYPQNKKKC